MNKRSGLSLFELLISLALLAIIGIGLAASLKLSINLWKRSTINENSNETVFLRTHLRIWLQNAIPPNRLTSFESSFIGSPSEFTFTTFSHTPFAPDAAAIQITVIAGDKKLSINVKALGDNGQSVEFYRGILSENIDARIEYFSAFTSPPGWQDSWHDDSVLPRLVKISAPAGSSPEWPEFIVKPRLR